MTISSADPDLTGGLSDEALALRRGGAPSRVGPYEVGRLLGQGGQGVVYFGNDLTTGREVALKALPVEWSSDPGLRARLTREARVLTLVDHPCIAAILGVEDTTSGLYLVLEYVPGQTLEQRLREGALPLTQAIALGRQLADGLDSAHARQVVHRDLKPANLKWTPPLGLKILDFGLAEVIQPDADGRGPRRNSGRAEGTVSYMSPEQIRGATPDRRVDVWAFGCVLYEALTGTRVWGTGSNEERLRAIAGEEPNWHRIPSATSPEVRALLADCLAKNPNRRLQEIGIARGILDRAGAAIDGRPVEVAADEPRGNLPRSLTEFVGREAELARLMAAIDRPGVVTIQGWGGTGKSRLALEAATRSRARFDHGAWFVELGVIDDPSRIATAVANALGVREAGGSSVIESLIRELRANRRLIILDGCELQRSAVAELVTQLIPAAPDLTILTTTREALGCDGEQRMELRPLGLPEVDVGLDQLLASEAIQFFLARARRAAIDFVIDDGNRAAVTELCRRLDGLPLALELAAARLRWLAVDGILRGLDERFEVLSGGSPLAPARHQTLEALVDWSYQHADPDERALLRAVSVFAGGFTLDAAEAVALAVGLDHGRMVDGIAGLLAGSLATEERRGDHVRYRLLETVRSFAWARLRHHDEMAVVVGGYLKYYSEIASAARQQLVGSEQRECFKSLDRDHDNLVHAMTFASEAAFVEQGHGIAADLPEYWLWNGQLGAGLERTEAVVARSDRLAPAVRARLHNAAGRLARELNVLDRAENHHRAAIRWSELSGDRSELAAATNGLGSISWQRGEPRSGETLDRAFNIYRELGDSHGMAAVLVNRGSWRMEQGDQAGATVDFEAALVHAGELGNVRAAATVASNLGAVAAHRNHYAAALTYATQSLELRRDLGDHLGIATSMANVASAKLGAGDKASAERDLLEALPLFRRYGRPEGVILVANNLATLAEDRGDVAAARAGYGESLEGAWRLGLMRIVPVFVENLASLAKSEGRVERALLLVGFADRLRAVSAMPILLTQQQVVEQILARAIDTVGDARTASLRALGATLADADGIAFALSDADRPEARG